MTDEEFIFDMFKRVDKAPMPLKTKQVALLFNTAAPDLTEQNKLSPAKLGYMIRKGIIDAPKYSVSGYQWQLKDLVNLLQILQDKTGPRYRKSDQWQNLTCVS